LEAQHVCLRLLEIRPDKSYYRTLVICMRLADDFVVKLPPLGVAHNQHLSNPPDCAAVTAVVYNLIH
jgi:hypothetical protein